MQEMKQCTTCVTTKKTNLKEASTTVSKETSEQYDQLTRVGLKML